MSYSAAATTPYPGEIVHLKASSSSFQGHSQTFIQGVSYCACRQNSGHYTCSEPFGLLWLDHAWQGVNIHLVESYSV